MLGKERIRTHAHCLAPVPKPQPSCPVPLTHKGSPELTLAKIDLLILSGTAAEIPCLQHFHAYMMSIGNVVSTSNQGESLIQCMTLKLEQVMSRLQAAVLLFGAVFYIGTLSKIWNFWGISWRTSFFKLVLGIKQCCVCCFY